MLELRRKLFSFRVTARSVVEQEKCVQIKLAEKKSKIETCLDYCQKEKHRILKINDEFATILSKTKPY